MERYICIHGHFYQPPRENPWLEVTEIQDSAYPCHDWNERVTAECYAPNSASRILDCNGRITDIVSNYTRISFDFGPTLLSWMEIYAPETYRAVLDADRQSMERHSGHGNATAQVYNHMIMPLADPRDKRTQILWGIRDFERRFQRFPEGMWLAETAVDLETLKLLAEEGIRFTILSPHQASCVRKLGKGKWKGVEGGKIDPSRPYLCRLPTGRSIVVFFYDGEISKAVAFEQLLNNGEGFVDRLMKAFSDTRDWSQLLFIATDGETYGHHQKFGDMALVYALQAIQSRGLAKITNFGEYLASHPPNHEVLIFENTSWSCMHGIERWRSNCGCNSGGRSGWNQNWRGPLRDAFDWLKGELARGYEHKAGEYLKSPWDARNDYIDVILDRSRDNSDLFIETHGIRELTVGERVAVLKLLEMQRHAMLMYTSCGWFFDELSGIETVQVIEYAGRAVQLAEELFATGLENAFLEKLALAESNLPEHGNGAEIYEKFVKPAMIDLVKVSAHYALSTVFEEYQDNERVFSYEVSSEDFHTIAAGETKLSLGRIFINSLITGESDRIMFCVLYFGGHTMNGSVRHFSGDAHYTAMKEEITKAFEQGDFVETVRLMDKHFGMHNYSLRNLFRDEQHKLLKSIIDRTLEDYKDVYTGLYEKTRILMGVLQESGMSVPRRFLTTAEIALNLDLEKELDAEKVDAEKIRRIIDEMQSCRLPPDTVEIELLIRRRLEAAMVRLREDPMNYNLLTEIRSLLAMTFIPVEINFWLIQNIYFSIAKTSVRDVLRKKRKGVEAAEKWVGAFSEIGRMLSFNTDSVLSGEREKV